MANALIQVINLIAGMLSLVIFLDVLLSWAPIDPYHPIKRLLHDISEPIVEPIRRIMPRTGMFDFSPMIALFAIQIVAAVLVAIVRAAFG